MALIQNLLLLWLAALVVEYLNKLAHGPERITIESWLPVPRGVAWGARYRYGGMLMYALIWFLVVWFKPEFIFLKMMGLIAWVLFITHGILGSFNYEIPFIPRNLRNKFIVDDIPNNQWFIFVPLSVIAICLACWYYIDVIIVVFELNIPLIGSTGLWWDGLLRLLGR